MLFYRIKNNYTEVCFRTDAPLYTSEEVTKYAMDTGIVEKSDERFEVCTIPSDEYREYLLKKIYRIFSKHLGEVKQSWVGKSINEICHECYRAVYITDVMHVIDDTDPSQFDYEVLEKWLENPEKLVKTVCDRIMSRENSDYNESICDYINQGLEE